MLMVTPKDAPELRPIASAMSPEVFAELSQNALRISASIETRQPQRYAEVYEGITPHWHVVTALPGQERTAADDLSDRRFGVYLPESEHTEVRRGRLVDIKRLMLPGYVFVFVWDVDEHIDRIKACEGVRGLLIINGKVAIVPDILVNRIRVVENCFRPLKGLTPVNDKPVKKSKRYWRKKRNTDVPVMTQENDIIGTHSYSPFLEELRAAADDAQPGAFHDALARLLQSQAESA